MAVMNILNMNGHAINVSGAGFRGGGGVSLVGGTGTTRDFVAVSRPVDLELAEVLGGLVSDGIIAPGFEAGTVERLSRKKNGRFLVMEADQEFVPPREEVREVYGVRLSQERPEEAAGPAAAGESSAAADGVERLAGRAGEDLRLGMVVARYSQSISVCYVRDGMTIGIGAGQQSRVDCTRLAGAKADIWWLRRHPKISGLAFRDAVRRQERINWQVRWCEGDLTAYERERFEQALAEPARELTSAERAEWIAKLDGVAFVSDGALPFRDNVDHAQRHGVRSIAEPGGSIRSDEVAQACAEYGITLTRTGLRLFHH